eukprot:TRINITY_DN76233_c0_g1_i1.p1 TRINITY_DN76233_c0_g1~~TRINITY_DN76233_c0_g1_i1.p1  ORF type:complete len:319 (+),score=63.02 TRINITY_DN76233_c0_g1_i1:277-1233(+)
MNLVVIKSAEAEAAAQQGGFLVLPPTDRRARHITSVLKPGPGATVRVGILGGAIGRVGVEVLANGDVRLALTAQVSGTEIDDPSSAAATPLSMSVSTVDAILPVWGVVHDGRPHVDLLLAMPRPKVMMRLWSTLAQLGIRRIILVNAARVEKAYFSSHAVEPTKYGPELLEGLEQAVCTHLPEVRVETRLKPFIEDTLDVLCPSEVLRLLCHPGDSEQRIAEAVSAAGPARHVLLAVGPEGGWVDYELELLRRHRFVQVTLGNRILTTDVALVSLIALATDALATRRDGAPTMTTMASDGAVVVSSAHAADSGEASSR